MLPPIFSELQSKSFVPEILYIAIITLLVTKNNLFGLTDIRTVKVFATTLARMTQIMAKPQLQGCIMYM